MRKRHIISLFLVAFLYAFFMASVAYIHSSILADSFGVPERFVGLLFSMGAVGGLVLAFVLPRFFARSYSVKQLLTVTIINAAAAMVILVTTTNIWAGVGATILYLVSNASFLYLGDVMVEHYSTPASTGRMRGLYMTMMAIAWMTAPILAGFITQQFGGFTTAYAMAGIIAALASLVVITQYESFVPHETHHGNNILGDIISFFRRKALRGIFMTNFLLQTFYVIMVIYVPIHLSQNIGLSWGHMGLIFAIMLGAFVILDYPLGYIADRWIREKWILSLGFVIAVGTTLVVATMTSGVWWVWAIVMFCTRVGASMIEMMNESYFFKHVDDTEVSYIAYYRNARSVAYIVVPVGASLMLAAFGLELADLFMVLAGTVGLGLLWSLRLPK